jgi:1-acyl-sn-glycerol-3-phosphate acyltransferase
MDGSRLSPLEKTLATVRGGVRMVEAAAEDAVAAFDALGVTGARGQPSDPFDARDPDYIRATVPAMGAVCKTYFRGEVSGLEHIPEEGPVLLVGNHSGGTMIADSFVFSQAFYERFGANRLFHQLAHDLVFKIAGLRTLVQRWGTVPASPENMRRALDRGAALLVYPGGDIETFRPSWQTSDIRFDGRMGFVRLALKHDVPIVPVVALGGQETALFLGRGRRVARALALDRLARLKVVPPVIGPPFGVTILDLPVRVPLPAKIRVRVMPPIDLRSELGRQPDVEEGYKVVTSRMQRTLTRIANKRPIPVVG